MKSTVRERVHRSHGAWRELLDEQAGSGLSQKAFCAQRGLALSSFYNAKRRASEVLPGAPATDFVALELASASDATSASHGDHDWEVELTLFDGVVLRMRRH